MRISTKGRYALNIMIDLAKNSNEDKYISLTEISKRLEISNKYLEQIIAALNKAKLVISTRGNNGGYRLAKSPNEYKHTSKKSVIVQKEVGPGKDCLTYSDGVKNALREDCDILVIRRDS